jgi:hypothetical protein
MGVTTVLTRFYAGENDPWKVRVRGKSLDDFRLAT